MSTNLLDGGDVVYWSIMVNRYNEGASVAREGFSSSFGERVDSSSLLLQRRAHMEVRLCASESLEGVGVVVWANSAVVLDLVGSRGKALGRD